MRARALARLRSVTAIVASFLLTGCAAMLGQQGSEQPAHPDFNTELLLQVLDDLDYVVTNYAWLLALLGL